MFVTYLKFLLFLRMRVKSQKLVLANNCPPSCLMYPDRHFANIYTSKMYKTVKTQTNLPVKICHLKVLFFDPYHVVITTSHAGMYVFSLAMHIIICKGEDM